jgi:RimJ/RimL family protein N-acetyltransferase
MIIRAIEGELIKLRKLRRSDAASIQRLADNKDIARYLPRLPYPYTMKEADRWITTTARLARQEKSYDFGIADNGSDEIAGMIGLRNINRQDKNAELGYWVGKPYQGRGYAAEAIRLILKFAFKELRLVRVYAVVHQRNVPSIKVLEKAGFMREGTWRKASFMGGRWSDVYAYGILKEEYRWGNNPGRAHTS